MFVKSILRASFAWACLICAATPASADIIFTYTAGAITGDTSAPAEEVTLNSVAGGATYNNITFNWYNGVNPEVANAFGNLYIFTSALDPTTVSPQGGNGTTSLAAASTASGTEADFIGESTSSCGSQYTFASAVTLTAGQTYFFLTDETGQAAKTADDDGTTQDAGTTRYKSTANNVDFTKGATGPGSGTPTGTYDFTLAGSVVAGSLTATPEPSTLAMLGSGGLAFLAYGLRARNRKKATA